MADPDTGVRYWGAMGVWMRGATELKPAHSAVVNLLGDSSPSVRIIAAEILGRYGTEDELSHSLEALIVFADPVANGIYVATQALNAIDSLGGRAAPLKQRVAALPAPKPTESDRVKPIVQSLYNSILRNV